MLEKLKEDVCFSNVQLKTQGLVILTWGNVSGYDPESKLMVIKPSGVNYEDLSPEKMVVVDMDGRVIEGKLKPSSDTKTHLEIYKAFPQIGSIVHTHSKMATSFAQAGLGVNPFGTTHADYFYGEIPCSRKMTEREIFGDYERETGKIIVKMLEGKDPFQVPALLINEHGPFTWGKTPKEAVYHSIVLEEVCAMAYYTKQLNTKADLQGPLLEKHYHRKHGKNSYYGQ